MRIRRGPGPDGDRSGQPAAGPGCVRHRLRADAARNRDAIVAVASEVFAEQGLAAPLEEIAARAGVGIGTLYRRFPSRRDLIDAALAAKVGQCLAAAEQALAEPDPWLGFTAFVQQACELQASDRGLTELLAATRPAGAETERLHQAASERIEALIERAKAAGALRPDVGGDDLALLLIGTGAIMQATRDARPGAWRRFVALALEGFAPAPRDPHPAVTTSDSV